MAELTKEKLKELAGSYVDASKQVADKFTATTDEFTKTLTKIGEMVTVYLPHVDKLPELNGNDLPFGEVIEEFMVNDFLPEDYTYEDGGVVKSSPRPTFDQAAYSLPLTDKKFELGIPYSQFQRVSLDAGAYANLVASSLSTLDSSYNAWNYACKRQLLGNVSEKVFADDTISDRCGSWILPPEDTASGEAFIKEVKKICEIASDMNDHNLAGHTCAGAPSLKLYIKQGVIPSLEVDTLAGAFNAEKLAVPAEIKTILDFGNVDNGVFAILIDPRGIKLKNDINEVESIAANFVVSTKRHIKQTGFISKYGFVHVFYDERV